MSASMNREMFQFICFCIVMACYMVSSFCTHSIIARQKNEIEAKAHIINSMRIEACELGYADYDERGSWSFKEPLP